LTFLLSEDKALREKLQGMVVHDQKADGQDTPRPVGVWFGQPDQEIRTQNYPYITIDMIDVQRDQSREMRGIVSPAYLDTTGSTGADGSYMHMPIPVSIDYQITAYSRHPRHDRAIITQLLFEKFPIRFGYLELDDGTIRRLDVMDVSKRDVTEQAKRLFVNAITVRVSSEVAQGILFDLYKVSTIKISNPDPARAGGRTSAPDYLGFIDDPSGTTTIP
jgi:hypothetical protein